MQIENYLKRYQPVIYKTFVNSLQNKHLSHAFLLSGNPGTPLLDVAKFLAKSIICDDPSPLACESCITCLRVDDNNYPDFIVYDGSKETIKKDDVQEIEKRFEMKAFESKGIMIYVLHLVENMTVEAINSILKFLEEPTTEIYAFLTTNNENNVLPTIISRCQLLRLKLVDRNEVIDSAEELGVERENAELLSYFYNDAELIFELMQNEDEKEDFLSAKEAIIGFINSLAEDEPRGSIYYVQHDIIPKITKKEEARFFLDMLQDIFENILNIQQGKDPELRSYGSTLVKLAMNIKNVDEKLIEILKDRNILNLNVNPSLLMDHLFLKIIGEE